MNSISAEQFAKSLIRKYPDPDASPYRSWSYPQGYLLMGIAKLYEMTSEVKYFDYISSYCEKHVGNDGCIVGFTGCSMDDMMAGAVLAWMAEQTHAAKFEKACRHIRAAFDDYPRTQEGGFWHHRTQFPKEMWVDGVFMGQMFLCRYGRVFDEPECFAETIHQLDVIYQYCHIGDGLLVHAYSEDCLAEWAGLDGRAREVWSEGLGWYALILMEVLNLIPENYPGHERIAGYARQLLEGLAKHQDRKTGLWFQVVNKGQFQDNWCDTSGSAMFTYAIQRGIDLELVPTATYDGILARAYDGLQSRIAPTADGGYDVLTACEGLCVQKEYMDYIHYPQKINAQEAVCGMLWALAAHDAAGK